MNYFSDNYKKVNQNTMYRLGHRSRFSLDEALDFDKKMLNQILNTQNIGEADRFNIASIYQNVADEYLNTCATSKEFEEFLIEVNGKEWCDNMMKKYLARKSRQLAKDWNCPSIANTEGVYIYNNKEDDLK